MFRAIPRPNRLCSEKKVSEDHQLHRKHLREMKPFIEISEPSQFGFLISRKKKEQLNEQRFTEIDRENKMLLQKISSIMAKRSPPHASGFTSKPSYSRFWETSFQRSLNKTFRKKELVKITFENQALLRRIQEKKSTVNFRTMEKDHRVKEKLLGNISEYPVLSLGKTAERKAIQTQETERRQFVYSSASLERNSRYSFAADELLRPRQTSRVEPIDPQRSQRTILFKNSKRINGNYFLIEVVLENNLLKIIADDVQMPSAKILEIPEKEGFLLMKRFKNNIDSLLGEITVEGEKMFLDGKKYEFFDKPAKTPKTSSKMVSNPPDPEIDNPAEIEKPLENVENPQNPVYDINN